MKLGFKIYFENKTVFVDKSTLSPIYENSTEIYKTTIDNVEVTWKFEPYTKGHIISLDVQGKEALGIKRIDSVVFDIGIPKKTDRIAFIGRSALRNETRYPWELGAGIEYPVDCLGHLADFTSKGPIFAGISPFYNVYASVAHKNSDNNITFCAMTEYTEGMLNCTSLSAERVFLCNDITLSEYLDAFRALIPTSKFEMPKLTGWNSWDYYKDYVTADDMLENTAALAKMPFADQLDYIVIDDGWQKAWGEWRENEKFSSGLKTVADNIKNAGFQAGIWMTPVGVRPGVSLLTEHTDWFCRDEKGELFFDLDLYYLDPTHPEAEAFILDNYRYQYDTGFRLFKMDYVSPLLKVKNFYDKTATAYSALTRMVERVKEYTGPDAVILGCSLPLECGPDVAPSMRISVDIHNFFPHVELIAQAMQWSWMFNNKITRIDPDFLVVRGDETSEDDEMWKYISRNDFVPPPRHKQTDSDRMKSHWCNGDMFNAVEAETWANLVCISGGNIFMSDRMSRLNDLGVSIIHKAFALAGDEVKPIFQKEDRRIASLWKGDKGLLLVNWEDVPRTLTVENIDGEITSEKEFILKDGKLTVSLLPHESFAAIYS